MMEERATADRMMMDTAKVVANRATCPRRKVGCVISNSKDQIIATGYNGVPRGIEHCIDKPCGGVHFPSGEGLDKCEAVHAEINALLQCPDVEDIHSIYVTAMPCINCTKVLLNTSLQVIHYCGEYGQVHMDETIRLWQDEGKRLLMFHPHAE